MNRPLRIGLSPSLLHPDPARSFQRDRRLIYLDEVMAHWILGAGALAAILPTLPPAGLSAEDLLAELDGVIMTGGVDVSPASYGEAPRCADWRGDPVRDAYDMALIRAALALDRPLLGVCRGHQILNVTLGGSLFQDIETQNPGALRHRDLELYDRNWHEVRFDGGGHLRQLYPGRLDGPINSVHHQAIKDLAPALAVEAWSPADGIIEAVRLRDGVSGRWALGVQWHPECGGPVEPEILPARPLLDDFLAAVARRRR